MLKYLPVYGMALQMLFNFHLGNCDQNGIRKLQPYEYILKMQLREPPVSNNGTQKTYDNITQLWLEQKLDNFDVDNKELWPMRYLVNDNYYRPGAPIFIFVGGEWEIQPYLLQSGHFYDMARQHDALMFYTEHRYYGQSWPKSNLTFENLKYLNVLQSLEDLRYFIDFQKSSAKALQQAKIVLVGGSYSGSMVAWFMKLYPDKANAAWASSAPLLAKMDFQDYMSLAMTSIKQKAGPNCAKKLDMAFKSLANIMPTYQFNRVLTRLNVCSTFDNTVELDRQAFFNGLGNYFAGLVQSYSSFIPQFCLSFMAADTEPLEALVKYLQELFATNLKLKLKNDGTQGKKGENEEEEWCLDFTYQGLKSLFTNVNDLTTASRPWFYQTCHEFGWFSTTISTLSSTSTALPAIVFGGQVPLTYFQQLCQDVFEHANVGHGNLPHHHHHHHRSLTLKQMHNRADIINKLFGGFSNISKRIIFTHGLLDPWRAVGLQTGINVLLLHDYSHVDDMGSIKLSDTVEMNVAKLKVASFINRLIKV